MQREAIAERPRGRAPSEWWARGARAYRLLLLAATVASASFALRSVWRFTIDDAGISYAYAKHLAEGEGPVAVVGGPWVEGYSNPLWVLLLVPLHALGLELPVAAKWLGVALFALGLGAGAAFVALASGRPLREPGAVSACFAVVFALCLELVVWVPAGLENALFGALLLGLVFLDARESETPTAFAGSGLAAFALSITRPEAAMYAAPLVLVKLGRALARREPMQQARTATLLFVVPFVLYHAGHYLVFGQLVANTYWAKPPDRSWDKGLEYLATTLRDSGLVYALPLALLGLYGKPRSKLLIAWAAVAGVVFVVYSGGDWMPNGRFVSLFAPALLALAALGLDRVARVVASGVARFASRVSEKEGRPREGPAQTRPLATALPREAITFGLSTALALGWLDYQRPRLERLERQGWCHFCERIADTQRVRQLGTRAALPSQSLVTHDFGGPAFLSDEGFYPLDFLGLCDRSAALLRHTRAPGSLAYDFRFYQYFIHEQATPPSWVLLPPNFWPLFDRSLEAVLDYYPVTARLLPRARRDSYFMLHRAELLDYFPPLPAAPPRALTERLALVGFAPFAVPRTGEADADRSQASHERLGPGARVLFVLSVVPRGPVQPGEAVGVRVEAEGERAESVLMPLDRGIDGLARALAPGEPLAVELVVDLPRAAAAFYRVSLGVGQAAPGKKGRGQTPPAFLPIGELPAGTPLAALDRSLPRYPSALPTAFDAELVGARAAVARVVEQSRRDGRAPDDAALSRSLVTRGERLEQDGDFAQAYLAYVWATQVRRRAWEELADRVFRLRQLALGDEHPMELALLRRYYANGTARELERLTAYYLSLGRWLEAEYFMRRLPDAAPGVVTDANRKVLHEMFARVPSDGAARAPSGSVLGHVAFDPLGGALDFEQEELTGWAGPIEAFRAGPRPDRHRLPGLRGAHGGGVLSSRGGGDRGRGALTSPEFRLDGQLLSVLVAGGSRKRRVGVELLVEGTVAFSASGNESDNLFPVFWDIVGHAGKSAQLRVFDESPRDHVVIDRVLIWR